MSIWTSKTVNFMLINVQIDIDIDIDLQTHYFMSNQIYVWNINANYMTLTANKETITIL